MNCGFFRAATSSPRCCGCSSRPTPARKFASGATSSIIASPPVPMPEPANELRFSLELDLALEETNPFDFILAPEAEHAAVHLSRRNCGACSRLSRKSRPTPALEIPRWKPPAAERRRARPSALLVELNEQLHECVGYERREEGPARSPQETLRLGRGACRDVAAPPRRHPAPARAGRSPNEWISARGGRGNQARGRFAPCLDGSLSAGRGLDRDGPDERDFLQSQFHRRRGRDRAGRRDADRRQLLSAAGRPTAQMTSRLELVSL